MKSGMLVFVLLMTARLAFGQQLKGTYLGELKLPSMSLRLVLNIEEEEATELWTLDSPDQGAEGIVVDSHRVEGQAIYFQVSKILAFYEGTINDDYTEIEGVFKQGGQQFDLLLVKQDAPVAALKRPQEPKAPFPYKVKEVTFKNEKADVELAGTLTMPKKGKDFTTVILVSGSGPQNRNEELMMHKPFLVIADYLTRNGFAVLRYDDRGVHESTGDFSSATTYGFADDAEAAVEFLSKQKKIGKIGIAGHSEGGLVAPMVAARNEKVDFVVMLAGPGTDMTTLLIKQTELILAINGEDDETIQQELALTQKVYDLMQSELSDEAIKSEINRLVDIENENRPEDFESSGMTLAQIKGQIHQQVDNVWFRTVLTIDPASYLPKVKCPVWAVNGVKDCQVPATENLARIGELLAQGGNQAVVCKAYPDLNHLFQHCESGAIAEYVTIEETFSEEVLSDLVAWLNQLK